MTRASAYRSRPRGPWRFALLGLAACIGAGPALAAGGSYATAGTGTYAQSLWWLDMTSYSDSAASLGGSSLSFTLPNNAGTFTAVATKATGLSTFTATAEPASMTQGAFGHGAYSGITGAPILYTQTLLVNSAVILKTMVVQDASGNARNFVFYGADGENTGLAGVQSEFLSFNSTGTSWTKVDTVNYFSGYSGTSPTVAGAGTATASETGTSANNFNAAYIFGTSNPTQVLTTVFGTQGALYAISLPTITFNVITLGRSDPSDQFTATTGYTSPAATIKTATTTSTVSTATAGALSVIGTNSMTLAASMATGSASPLTYYSGSMACTNSGPGPTGYGGTATVLPSGTGTSFALTPKTGDTIVCTLTLTPIAQTLKGTVYSDTNHDASLDGSEAGTGLAGLYIKLAPSAAGTCQTTATAAVTVDPTAGTYSIPAVASGTYCLTLSNNATLSNTSPYRPAGWVNSEAPTGVRQLDATVIPAPVQNFGLYNGSSVAVTVFGDNGSSAGTANDGVQNGGETGLGNLTVTASVGGTVIATATTNGTGATLLWLPASTSGTVTLATVNPAGYLATGGGVGTTAGTYARPNITFTFASGSAYTGIGFGLILPNSLAANGVQSAQAGTVLFYPHVFIAGSAGSVTFATSALATPATSGWSEVLYLDTACAGQFVSTDTAITAAVNATAAQRICVLVKEFVPAGAPLNAQNKVTISATFVYSGSAAPGTSALTNTDTTTVTRAAATQVTKQVQNVTQAGAYLTSNTALPGNTLQYQVTIVNQGSSPVSTVVVNDSTPPYTTFVSAACPGTLPTTLTACALSTQPSAGAAGPVQWTFSGTLSPGTQTTVTYQVTVAQ